MSLASWERGAGVDPAELFGTVSADITLSAQRGCTRANHPDVVESDRGRARSEQHRRENFFQILAVEFYFVLDPETIRAVRHPSPDAKGIQLRTASSPEYYLFTTSNRGPCVWAGIEKK